MKLDFCATDIKFSEFDPRTMIIEVEEREYYEPFIKAVKLTFPKMTRNWDADSRFYDSGLRWFCLDRDVFDEMVHGVREAFRTYKVIELRELIYVPIFSESDMDIKFLFEK